MENKNNETKTNLLAEVEYLLLDNITTESIEYIEVKNYIESCFGPRNTPCGNCKNANWFISTEIVEDKIGIELKYAKCYCSKLFRETIDMKVNGMFKPIKFIQTCGGNPTFIKK